MSLYADDTVLYTGDVEESEVDGVRVRLHPVILAEAEEVRSAARQ